MENTDFNIAKPDNNNSNFNKHTPMSDTILKSNDNIYQAKNVLQSSKILSAVMTSFGISKGKEPLDKKLVEFIGDDCNDKNGTFVPMDYYRLTNAEENFFTFGIASCCGLVIFTDDGHKFLMHISPKNSADKILMLLDALGLSTNGKVYVFPGKACEFQRSENKFDYVQLVDKLSLYNSVTVIKFNSMSGGVYLVNNRLVIDDDGFQEIENLEKQNGIKR